MCSAWTLLSLVCLMTLATSTVAAEAKLEDYCNATAQQVEDMKQQGQQLKQQLWDQSKKVEIMLNGIESLLKCKGCDDHEVFNRNNTGERVTNCSEATVSGVYTIVGSRPDFQVHCHVDTTGKWTVIQRREDGSVDFYRDWEAYRLGFGSVDGEHWLGNDNIHALTAAGHNQLRVDLKDWNNVEHSVQYKVFDVAGAEEKYQLTVSGFLGKTPPGDSFYSHNGKRFSTFDQDNDESTNTNCASDNTGGWWFWICLHNANLNGLYNSTESWRGVNWLTWKGRQTSLQGTQMLVK